MGAELAVLKELAALFAPLATLYAVGGYSRSLLLGVPPKDIDICSKLPLEDVKTLLSNTRFVVSEKSMRLGTATVTAPGFAAEYILLPLMRIEYLILPCPECILNSIFR